MAPRISVIIPAHNPHLGRLRSTLSGLRAQSLDPAQWETILVDNASTAFPPREQWEDVCPANLRMVSEPRLGLTYARMRGFHEAGADCAVLVDDDNVLAPDYLEQVLSIFASWPGVGAIGGKSIGQFESEPPEWVREFMPLLALRDLGEDSIVSTGLRPPGASRNQYPACAPIGAGMALRRAAWLPWLAARESSGNVLSDRRGSELTSSGDNDIVFGAMHADWQVGYFPQLALRHLIPSGRTSAEYLERLNRGIQKSWMQLLTVHDANPWQGISPMGAVLRKARAWWTYRGWQKPQGRIRWQGACGHFDGRVVRPRAAAMPAEPEKT
jgi:glycosyltransferase involved in cell wall biosynthesis